MSIIPIKGLFETHLTVSDLDASITFYRDVVGLQLAHRVAERHAAFLWIGAPGRAMLGLWSLHSSPVRLRLHLAFDAGLDDVVASVGPIAGAGHHAARRRRRPAHRRAGRVRLDAGGSSLFRRSRRPFTRIYRHAARPAAT